nr:MAG TPA: hypothetical protein [Caudoviricetes sp.]
MILSRQLRDLIGDRQKRKPPAVSKDANHILTNKCELPHDRGLYAFSRDSSFCFYVIGVTNIIHIST